ncbi:hypothetical protein [Paludibaculum fermentans]|uniref:RCC1 domain-containing protein n=1 Tax=Paludibaculum fermentans TaxID=1473598 RepID=UPI003EBC5ED8
MSVSCSLPCLPALSLLCFTAFQPLHAGTPAHRTIYLLQEKTGPSQPLYPIAGLGVLPGAARIAVSTAGRHILVLTETGAVWAWGANHQGQLGTGDTQETLGWSQVPGLAGIVQVAAGGSHSLALDRDGVVWAWGANLSGQLGDGTLLSRSVPAKVPDLSGITSIAAGDECSAARAQDGSVLVFGADCSGAPAHTLRLRPTRLAGRPLDGAITIQAGQVRPAPARQDAVAWPGALQLAREVRWGTSGFALNESGWTTQRHAAQGAVADLAAGWAVAWIEGPPLATSASAPVATAGATQSGVRSAAAPDLSIALTAGVPFTVTRLAGYVVTITNTGDTSTSGTITVAATLPAGLVPGGGSGNGWTCQTAGQDVTCTMQGPLTPASSSVLYLTAQVNQSAYPSVSSTVSVDVQGDGNPANNTATLVQSVASPPMGAYAAGEAHSVRLASDGTVWTAGSNTNGQLGDGTRMDRSVPTRVSGLNGVVAIAAALNLSHAVKSDGTVWSWGRNSRGQLGDGSQADRFTPVQAVGLTSAVSVAAYGRHSLALQRDGRVWAWGLNSSGQLGDGTTLDRPTPVAVANLDRVAAIAAGTVHSLALRADGTVWGWGSGGSGQSGGNLVGPYPVQVPGLSGAVAVAAGELHSLALTADGTVWGWGGNGAGELGDGTTTGHRPPAPVLGLTGVVAIAAGYGDSMALKQDGTVWFWGRTSGSKLPVQVNGIANAVSIATSGPSATASFYVLRADGSALAWGNNRFGQLGNGTPVSRAMPKRVAGLTGVKQVAARDYSLLAVKQDGTVWGWGMNEMGQTGDQTTASPRATPVQAIGLTQGAAAAAGTVHSLVLRQDGTVVSWGLNEWSGLGYASGQLSLVPQTIPGLSNVVKVTAALYRTLVVRNDGALWAWGTSVYGELGDGTVQTERQSPIQVPGLTGVVDAAAGDDSSVALTSDGNVWAWGNNTYNQLGDGTTTDRLSPIQVPGLTGITAVSIHFHAGLALKNDGTVWTWGTLQGGGMGDGTTSAKPSPVPVSGLSGMVAISAGRLHCLALKNDGTVWAWGQNDYGQVGDGTTVNRLVPVRVPLPRPAVAISAGSNNSAVLLDDGTVATWGTSLFGQLGNGITSSTPLPAPVLSPDAPDLTIALTDSGPASNGGTVVYTITVTNAGRSATSGTITVTDPLPAGLAYSSATGTGWSCSAAGQVVTCTNPAALAAGASSVITLKATVLAAALPSITNIVEVSNAADGNPINNFAGDPLPLIAGTTAVVSLTPSAGAGFRQIFQAQFSGVPASKDLRWVQLLFGAAPDGGGQPFCFLHYDVQGNGFWLYSDVYGFFRGPVAPGLASLELQGSHCALSTAGSTVAASGSTLSLNLDVVFKAPATRNVYLRAMDLSNYDTGWVQRGAWTQAATPLPVLMASPQGGSGSTTGFALAYPDLPGFAGIALGWKQFLIAAAPDGGGQPFCFVHYDEAGNGLWMYSSDLGFFVGPATPLTDSNLLDSSACSINSRQSYLELAEGNRVLHVALTLKPPMSGTKNLYVRTLDALTRDTGWQAAGTWIVP